MGDKIKISVLEGDGGTEFDVPVERSLTSDIVQFDPSGTIFDSANDDVDLILKQASTIIQGIQTLLNAHASRHLPEGADALATAIASTLSALTNNTVGTNNSFARSDHTHNIETGNVISQTPDQANSEGTSANLARADHRHNIPTSTPVNTGTANSQGSSNSFAKADHIHNTIINTSHASSNVEVSTNSTTNIILNAMSVTPIVGTYTLIACVVLSSNDRNSDNFLGIYKNGVLQANTEEAMENNQSNSATDVYMTYFAIIDNVTANGTDTFDIRVRTTTGTTTYYIRNLLAIRKG